MSESDFLLIVPQGWTEIPTEAWKALTTVTDITGAIADNNYVSLDMQFVDTPYLPEGGHIVGVQYFQDGAGVEHVWLQVA